MIQWFIFHFFIFATGPPVVELRAETVAIDSIARLEGQAQSLTNAHRWAPGLVWAANSASKGVS